MASKSCRKRSTSLLLAGLLIAGGAMAQPVKKPVAKPGTPAASATMPRPRPAPFIPEELEGAEYIGGHEIHITAKEAKLEEKGYSFVNGVARATANGRFGYIDANEQWIIQPVYQNTREFMNLGIDNKIMVKQKGKWGVINLRERILVPIVYDSLDIHNYNNLFIAYFNGKLGVIDEMDSKIIDFKWDDIKIDSLFKDEMAAVKLNSKWGFIDRQGATRIGFLYDNVGDGMVHSGLISVQQNGKWGYINPSGKVQIPFQYDEAYSFDDGKAFVVLGEKSFYINPQGQPVEE